MELVNRTFRLDVKVNLNGLNATDDEARAYVEALVTKALIDAAVKPPPIKDGEKFSRIIIERVQMTERVS